MNNIFQDKTILVTGGTGSIGSVVVSKLLEHHPKQIRVLSRDENKQYYLTQKLNYPQNLRLLIGDIRDQDRINMAMEKVDIVIHTAALKHVPLCEYNPFEAIKTNIIGSQNVISAALKNNVKKVIAVSTDKAANPINIMGVSKLMMEKVFINANYYTAAHETTFACVRLGNVLWSNGSVLNLWKQQVDMHNTIHITGRGMTRFFISKDQAVDLILKAATASQRGEIFILKMPAVKMSDLARQFISKYFPNRRIKIEIKPSRPGEKIHEDLFDQSDLQKTILENKEMFIVAPNFHIYHQISNIEPAKNQSNSYHNFKSASRSNIHKYYSSRTCANSSFIKKII